MSQPTDEQVAEAQALVSGTFDLTDDGRIDIDVNSPFARVLRRTARASIDHLPLGSPPAYTTYTAGQVLPLNIVIHVVGSRGDVQPFIALGKELQKHNHRVRLATHDVFAEFVRGAGLNFFPVGGNPSELMAYMVKNPGLIPSMKSLRAGEISKKQAMVGTMLEGFWRSCIVPDPLTQDPFVAEAIIANPPSFAHLHCAQALSIPCHLMFTMPWTSTRSFPHPLANLRNATGDPKMANYISYGLVDFMTWQGLGGVINAWRGEMLCLPPIAMTESGIVETLKIPVTYCWSPVLVPRPADWGPHIDVCGFFFRDPPSYAPDPELSAFLANGPPPVYIGFGSIVIDHPEELSAMIAEAVRLAGVRAIVSRGWSNLSGPENPNILYIGDCPHEWLFQHVAAVVHHGGAGTTACGLRYGKPTIILPFFGDQFFWSEVISAAGAGPTPQRRADTTASSLAESIQFCFEPEVAARAASIAANMKSEAGVEDAVKSFHANLPLQRMRCDLLPEQVATWTYRKGKTSLKLSKLAAKILIENKVISANNLKIYGPQPIWIETKRWDPITASFSAMLGTFSDAVVATTGIVTKPYAELRRGRSAVGEASTNPSILSNNSVGNLTATTGASATTLARLSTTDGPPTLAETADKLSTGQERGAPSSGGGTVASVHTDTPTTPRKAVPSRSSTDSSRTTGKVAAKMATASGKSVGDFMLKNLKGALVDVPLATAEGLRMVPKLYGEEQKDFDQITGVKSGFLVAGNRFYRGMYEGFTDIVTLPHKGRRERGAVGVATGVGKGILSMATKTSTGLLGLWAYPAEGISQSIRSGVKRKTRRAIADALLEEGGWRLAGVGDAAREEHVARVRAAFPAREQG